MVADFSHPDDLKQTLAEQLSTFEPIQILINNTGGPPPPTGLIQEADVVAEFLEAFSKHLICNQLLALMFHRIRYADIQKRGKMQVAILARLSEHVEQLEYVNIQLADRLVNEKLAPFK